MDTLPCPGCLGSGDCWVCLGTGAADTERLRGTCSSCSGSRRCRYCPAPADRLHVHPGPGRSRASSDARSAASTARVLPAPRSGGSVLRLPHAAGT